MHVRGTSTGANSRGIAGATRDELGMAFPARYYFAGHPEAAGQAEGSQLINTGTCHSFSWNFFGF